MVTRSIVSFTRLLGDTMSFLPDAESEKHRPDDGDESTGDHKSGSLVQEAQVMDLLPKPKTVAQTMETNIPGIYAAGDITTYPGKLKLIATGFAEACIAVNQIAHFLNPAAKVMPGHSSNMALFGQKED